MKRTQQDSKERVVALSNLEAMCDRISGTCHRFCVSKVTANRVYVQYSNPDEYGNESPMEAVFPCYPNSFDGADNPFVVLHFVGLRHDNRDGEGWQCFQALLDCPVLFRRNPDSNDWRTEDEWKKAAA